MTTGLTISARIFIFATAILGAAVFASSVLLNWQTHDPARFCTYLVLAVLCSRLNIALPGMQGTVSVSFLFVMMGLLELTEAETMTLACVTAFSQCFSHAARRTRAFQVAFNVGSMAIAVAAAHSVYSSPEWSHLLSPGLLLILASATFFLLNTFPVAAAITLTENRPLSSMFRECYLWSFPFYVIGGCIAWTFHEANRQFGWYASILVFPATFLVYRSSRMYLGRLEAEKAHAEETAALHLRTIEALALAIEAKDHTTRRHLIRLELYAVEIAKEMGLSGMDLEAIRAGALLHDIGKLAVPEHIISKPGKLTHEEFEKVKIHPVIGAEILEGVHFPYPVIPIVRAHHEKWNGSGYPDGLKGDEIPIGARILAAADVLDALASDRRDRKALSIDVALRRVVALSGISFDPRVVEIMERRFDEFEEKIRNLPQKTTQPPPHQSDGVRTRSGPSSAPAASGDFLASIIAARQELQALFELSQDLGNSLSLDEILSLLAVRVKRIVPYDALAIYMVRDQLLKPEFVSGEDARFLASLEIPIGSGLSGWVADHGKPILNGNPGLESASFIDARRCTGLRSALAVPLDGGSGVIGVLTLYHVHPDGFSRDHLRILLSISGRLAVAIENAMRFRQAEQSAATDYLTGLPNARSLFLHLDSEVARCRRLGTSLTVVVCDLNGFKQVNDRFGHLEGNRVLQVIGRKLKESLREYDYVARLGGDEFIVVMPGLGHDGIQAMLARLHDLTGEAGREVNPEAEVSFSLGVAEFPTDGSDAEQLLADADRKMYHDKQSRKAFAVGQG